MSVTVNTERCCGSKIESHNRNVIESTKLDVNKTKHHKILDVSTMKIAAISDFFFYTNVKGNKRK